MKRLKISNLDIEDEILYPALERFDLDERAYEQWAGSATAADLLGDYKVISVMEISPTEHDIDNLSFYRERITFLKKIYYNRFQEELPQIEVEDATVKDMGKGEPRSRRIAVWAIVSIFILMVPMFAELFFRKGFGRSSLVKTNIAIWGEIIGIIIITVPIFIKKWRHTLTITTFFVMIICLIYSPINVHSFDGYENFKFWYNSTVDLVEGKTETVQWDRGKLTQEYTRFSSRQSEIDRRHIFMNGDILLSNRGLEYMDRYKMEYALSKAKDVQITYYVRSRMVKQIKIDDIVCENEGDIPEVPKSEPIPETIETNYENLQMGIKVTKIYSTSMSFNQYHIEINGETLIGRWRNEEKPRGYAQGSYTAYYAEDFEIIDIGIIGDKQYYQLLFEEGVVGIFELSAEQMEILHTLPVRTIVF